MTKEAKLTAAVRILHEWKDYDEEIRQLQKKIDSGLLDADPAEQISNVKGEKFAFDLCNKILFFVIIYFIDFFYRKGWYTCWIMIDQF